MQEFPSTVFLSKDLCDSQSPGSQPILVGETHLFSFDRHGEGQTSINSGVEVFDSYLGSTFLELRRCPIVSRPDFLPALFVPTECPEYRDIIAVRRILFPKSGITIDKASDALFPTS